MINENSIKQILNPEEKQRLIRFFEILIEIDIQIRAKKRLEEEIKGIVSESYITPAIKQTEIFKEMSSY